MKEETLYVVDGELRLTIEHDGDRRELPLRKGEAFHIPPRLIHRMYAVVDTDVAEVSTPELRRRRPPRRSLRPRMKRSGLARCCSLIAVGRGVRRDDARRRGEGREGEAEEEHDEGHHQRRREEVEGEARRDKPPSIAGRRAIADGAVAARSTRPRTQRARRRRDAKLAAAEEDRRRARERARGDRAEVLRRERSRPPRHGDREASSTT